MNEERVIATGKSLMNELEYHENERRKRKREWKCIEIDAGHSPLGHRVTYCRMVRR
jgi:hypothetical protein